MFEICCLPVKAIAYCSWHQFLHLITILCLLPRRTPCKANHSHLQFAQFLSGSDHVRLLV